MGLTSSPLVDHARDRCTGHRSSQHIWNEAQQAVVDPPLIVGGLAHEGGAEGVVDVADRRQHSRSGPENPLSERETQILQRISQGATSAEIATEMGLPSDNTANALFLRARKELQRRLGHGSRD